MLPPARASCRSEGGSANGQTTSVQRRTISQVRLSAPARVASVLQTRTLIAGVLGTTGASLTLVTALSLTQDAATSPTLATVARLLHPSVRAAPKHQGTGEKLDATSTAFAGASGVTAETELGQSSVFTASLLAPAGPPMGRLDAHYKPLSAVSCRPSSLRSSRSCSKPYSKQGTGWNSSLSLRKHASRVVLSGHASRGCRSACRRALPTKLYLTYRRSPRSPRTRSWRPPCCSASWH